MGVATHNNEGIAAIAAQRELSNIVSNIDDEIAEEMAKCYLDPYRFVLIAFDWGARRA